jgi:hypothetical protein
MQDFRQCFGYQDSSNDLSNVYFSTSSISDCEKDDLIPTASCSDIKKEKNGTDNVQENGTDNV